MPQTKRRVRKGKGLAEVAKKLFEKVKDTIKGWTKAWKGVQEDNRIRREGEKRRREILPGMERDSELGGRRKRRRVRK